MVEEPWWLRSEWGWRAPQAQVNGDILKIFFHLGVLPIFPLFHAHRLLLWIFSFFSEYFSFCFILRLWIQSEKSVCNRPFPMVMWPPGVFISYLVVCHHPWWWLYILHHFPFNSVEKTFVPMYKPSYWLGQVYIGVNKFSSVKPSFTEVLYSPPGQNTF